MNTGGGQRTSTKGCASILQPTPLRRPRSCWGEVKSRSCAAERNDLSIRNIRCDLMSIHSMARILHVRKSEIRSWIEKGWLEATVCPTANGQQRLSPLKHSVRSTHDTSANSLRRRESQRGAVRGFLQLLLRAQAHHRTQLLTVRRDKRERAAFMAMQNGQNPRRKTMRHRKDFASASAGYGLRRGCKRLFGVTAASTAARY